MNKAETKFMSLVNKLSSADDDVFLGKMMSSPGIKYKDKVFAFFNKDAMGFRLDTEFDIKKFGVKNPKPLSPFKTKPPLKGWWIVDYEEHKLWESLTELSLSYTKSLK